MTFLERIKNEPALITSVLVAVFNLFAVDPELSGSLVQILGVALPLILGFIVRQNVAGPVTKETLAKGTLQTKPTPEQKKKAAQVLGLERPAQPIPPELLEAAEAVADLLPAPISTIIKTLGVPGLQLAVQTAQNGLKHAPSSKEMTDRYIDKAKAGQ